MARVKWIQDCLSGVGSLSNISGGYISFRRYMRGNNLDDMLEDWNRIGKDLHDAMYRK